MRGLYEVREGYHYGGNLHSSALKGLYNLIGYLTFLGANYFFIIF